MPYLSFRYDRYIDPILTRVQVYPSTKYLVIGTSSNTLPEMCTSYEVLTWHDAICEKQEKKSKFKMQIGHEVSPLHTQDMPPRAHTQDTCRPDVSNPAGRVAAWKMSETTGRDHEGQASPRGIQHTGWSRANSRARGDDRGRAGQNSGRDRSQACLQNKRGHAGRVRCAGGDYESR